jgi:hypothetical protein
LLQEPFRISNGLGMVTEEALGHLPPSRTEHVRLHGSGDNLPHDRPVARIHIRVNAKSEIRE